MKGVSSEAGAALIFWLNLFLKRQTRCPIRYINNPAIMEPMLAQDMLQDPVVVVRIDPEIGGVPETPRQTLVSDAGNRTIRCQTMQHGIGRIVQPRTIIDMAIGRVLADNETEGRHNPPRRKADITMLLLNLAEDKFPLRIAGNPLVRIPGSRHKGTCDIENRHDCLQIVRQSQADFHSRFIHRPSRLNRWATAV